MDLNLVVLSGRLAAPPELRVFESGRGSSGTLSRCGRTSHAAGSTWYRSRNGDPAEDVWCQTAGRATDLA